MLCLPRQIDDGQKRSSQQREIEKQQQQQQQQQQLARYINGMDVDALEEAPMRMLDPGALVATYSCFDFAATVLAMEKHKDSELLVLVVSVCLSVCLPVCL